MPPLFRQLARYGVVGVTSNLTTYGIFLGLYYLGMPPVIATGVVYVIGVCISYVVNRNWTFESKSVHGQDLPKFVLAYGLGFVVSLISMWGLLHWIPAEFAQLMTIFISAAMIFTLLKLLRFGENVGG